MKRLFIGIATFLLVFIGLNCPPPISNAGIDVIIEITSSNGINDYIFASSLANSAGNDPTLNLMCGKRYKIINKVSGGHPFSFVTDTSSYAKQLAQSSNGALEGDSQIKWEEAGNEIAFTVTSVFMANINNYICEIHPTSMQGSITYTGCAGPTTTMPPTTTIPPSTNTLTTTSNTLSTTTSMTTITTTTFDPTSFDVQVTITSGDFIDYTFVDDTSVTNGTTDPALTFTLGMRYHINNQATGGHPFGFYNTALTTAYLSQLGAGTLEADPDINWYHNGNNIYFTVDTDFQSLVTMYRCEFHTGMSGTVTVP